ncbi:DMT family transporter [Streptomyces sp. V4I2]|uniref:DMT family transporter n=1 Tax=Streptomyces sp. V4I2 TaxID=3042280 RepID=UPI00278220D3|nr:DMT family transporter [Streptomyces sp. V4I2]MDQ1050359.1 drug/metabolite transporter (DMT)-like permease [Streptomyces sp. V4I2]
MNLLLSVAFVLCWSSGFVGAKLGTEDAGAVTILMWRFLPLAAVLAVAALVRSRTSWRGLTARDLGRQALIGLLSQSGYLLTVYWAIQLGVSSGTTALIDGTQPLVAGALAGPLLRQYVSGRQWLGLCLGLAGVGLVTTADAGANSGVAWWTYLVPFAGMLSLVAATFLEQRSRTHVTPAVSMTVHCVTSALVFTGAALATGSATPPSTSSFWIAIGWLVTLSTFGGYGLYWLVLRRSGVTKVNTLMFLMAPVTAVWGAAMFDEPFTPQTAAGLAVSLGAVAVVHSASPHAPQVHGHHPDEDQGEPGDGRKPPTRATCRS